jgi:MFS superfamily sulfate permease-like transporter
MNIKWINVLLAFTTVLSGFYGGIGFFTLIGGNPALRKLSTRSFAEYWQHIDHYMAARMPFFGITLMLTVLAAVIILARAKQPLSAMLFGLAFLFLIGDMVFTLKVNHPLNTIIQSWELNHLPDNVHDIQAKVVYAFSMRLWLMISAFVLVVAGVMCTTGHYRANQTAYRTTAREL